MKWLGNRMWYDLTHVDQRAMEVADFLVVDDIRTILDPKSSNFDKGLALAGFIPIGKILKGGKLVVKFVDNEGMMIERATEATKDALKAVKQVSWEKFSPEDFKGLAKADQKDIRQIIGNSDDAFNFFRAQITNYTEVSKGIFVGTDAHGVTFTFRASSKSGPPTIDINGISGVRKIKFLED